jgi:hypothetical protein
VKKFSVVIPTMWFSHRTESLIKDLCDVESVSEVIVIDNNHGAAPDLPGNDKLIVLVQDENIYVNPAWNLGVAKSKEENICLLNDDVSSDWAELFGHMSSIEDDKYCIGVHPVSYQHKETGVRVVDGSSVGRGWGCCIFLSKNHWQNIPENIKIYYGDNFLVDVYGDAKSFMGWIETEMSTTSRSPRLTRDQDYCDILSSDSLNYEAWKSSNNI